LSSRIQLQCAAWPALRNVLFTAATLSWCRVRTIIGMAACSAKRNSWFIGEKSPRRFSQTASSLPPAKGVAFAGCLVPALLANTHKIAAGAPRDGCSLPQIPRYPASCQ
jgi:hypothetical protein